MGETAAIKELDAEVRRELEELDAEERRELEELKALRKRYLEQHKESKRNRKPGGYLEYYDMRNGAFVLNVKRLLEGEGKNMAKAGREVTAYYAGRERRERAQERRRKRREELLRRARP